MKGRTIHFDAVLKHATRSTERVVKVFGDSRANLKKIGSQLLRTSEAIDLRDPIFASTLPGATRLAKGKLPIKRVFVFPYEADRTGAFIESISMVTRDRRLSVRVGVTGIRADAKKQPHAELNIDPEVLSNVEYLQNPVATSILAAQIHTMAQNLDQKLVELEAEAAARKRTSRRAAPNNTNLSALMTDSRKAARNPHGE